LSNPIRIHIIKVLEKETAHTKPLEEVKDSIRGPLMWQADDQASRVADQLAAAIRKSNRTLWPTLPRNSTSKLLKPDRLQLGSLA